MDLNTFILKKKNNSQDIKPNNILFCNIDDPVIADFVQQIFKDQIVIISFRNAYTRNYVAPEIIKRQYYDYKVDIYSLRVLFHILLTTQIPHPWDNYNNSPNCQILLIGMLHSNPNNRFSISEIRQSNIIRRIQRRVKILNAMGNLSDVIKTNLNISKIQIQSFQL